MRTINTNVTKALVGSYPRVLFEGRVKLIQTAEEAEKATDYLLSSDIIGIDTETRPSFQKGVLHKVALLQASTRDTCFLYRLNRMGMAPAVARLLGDTTVPKVGLSLHDDFRSLLRLGSFKKGYFIELQDYVKSFGIQDMSLQKLYANIFHLRISKGQRLTNWEGDVLTEAQMRYAATDAWACIKIYEELQHLGERHNFRLEETADLVESGTLEQVDKLTS